MTPKASIFVTTPEAVVVPSPSMTKPDANEYPLPPDMTRAEYTAPAEVEYAAVIV
jgi:hypothetical protein